MTMTLDTDESIRCTASGCSCISFKPGNVDLRSCDRCGHGWVVHALEKLQAPPSSSCGPVEVALPGLVFDLSSLVLYGAQAVPVRLKILLDRLYSVLTPEQVGHILHTLGWSLGDYIRGYMLQYPGGKVLDRWMMVTNEEEPLVLKQFLRFGETRPIVEVMTLHFLPLSSSNCLSDPEPKTQTLKTNQSNVSTFTERNGGTTATFRNSRSESHFADRNDNVHHFENFVGGLSLLLPFHLPSSTFQYLVPPTKDLVPLVKPTPCLQTHHGTRPTEEDQVYLRSKCEPGRQIKSDPDKPNPTQSLWHPNPRVLSESELENSSFIPASPSLHPSISSSSSSPPKIYHKLQGSSPSSFHPLPSFSSSFLCPPPASSFSSSLHPLRPSSSSLHPLPSSPCSLPPPAGGRKGRVCCGVCGKSFYDKGTLKIHYNAVHLKIKHRCTVSGCSMVFSSLRSRNRHSANPNPRLHTGAGRDAHNRRHVTSGPPTRDKDGGDVCWQQEDDGRSLTNVRAFRNGHVTRHHGDQLNTPPQPDSPPPSPHPGPPHTNHTSTCRSTLHLQVVPPPPLLLPVHAGPSVSSPPSLVPLVPKTERCHHPLGLNAAEARRGEPTNQRRRWESGDTAPKKKPRKSSTPVKIDREKLEWRRRSKVEEE